jgi:outer membrane lipoprotein-sorting protein
MCVAENNYLNNIEYLVADFDQTSSSKPKMRGKFWLKRPKTQSGRMRIDYENQHIFANANELRLYNLKEKSLDSYDSSQTPAHFILRKKVDLAKDFKIKGQKQEKLVRAISLQTDQADVTMFFRLWGTGNIRYLMGWDIKDSQGHVTQVRFNENSIRINDPKTVPETLFDAEKQIRKKVK